MPAQMSFRQEIDELMTTDAPRVVDQAVPVVTNVKELVERIADKCDELGEDDFAKHLGPIRELTLIGNADYELEDLRTRLDVIITTLKNIGEGLFPALDDVTPIGEADYEIEDIRDRLDAVLTALKSA